MLLLMLSVVLMAGAWLWRGLPRGSLARHSTRRPRRRTPLLVLGLALTLMSISTGAWAKQPGDTGAVMQGATPSARTAPLSRGTEPATAPDYASREASAKGLETFKGGDTVVVFGGSVLLIVLIVVLVVVLI